jgi:putative mycofactocin binding protein MftB
VDLGEPYELDPQVAVRPEPFGALCYHYGNRRLTFLRSAQMKDLVESLAAFPTARDALVAAGIDEKRWPTFERALASLESSEVIRVRN